MVSNMIAVTWYNRGTLVDAPTPTGLLLYHCLSTLHAQKMFRNIWRHVLENRDCEILKYASLISIAKCLYRDNSLYKQIGRASHIYVAKNPRRLTPNKYVHMTNWTECTLGTDVYLLLVYDRLIFFHSCEWNHKYTHH